MDVRAIVGLLAPTVVEARAVLNRYRARTGIVAPLERATIHRWFGRGVMPSKWLQTAAIAILEEGGPDAFARFGAALVDLPELDRKLSTEIRCGNQIRS